MDNTIHFTPQRLLNKAKRKKSTWSDSLPIFLAKEHKTRTRRNWATLWTPLEGINSWWGWRRSCACAHSTWSRREQGAQPAEHRVHGQHGHSPTSLYMQFNFCVYIWSFQKQLCMKEHLGLVQAGTAKWEIMQQTPCLPKSVGRFKPGRTKKDNTMRELGD